MAGKGPLVARDDTDKMIQYFSKVEVAAPHVPSFFFVAFPDPSSSLIHREYQVASCLYPRSFGELVPIYPYVSILPNSMILVTSYQDPDLDGTACSVAEAE
ncbi:MAG: hypothetical protein AAB413_01375 [Patescibacteria group bacterium]